MPCASNKSAMWYPVAIHWSSCPPFAAPLTEEGGQTAATISARVLPLSVPNPHELALECFAGRSDKRCDDDVKNQPAHGRTDYEKNVDHAISPATSTKCRSATGLRTRWRRSLVKHQTTQPVVVQGRFQPGLTEEKPVRESAGCLVTCCTGIAAPIPFRSSSFSFMQRGVSHED